MSTTNYVKDFGKILHELAYPSQWQIDAFRDFLIMAHISIANNYYKSKEMEEEYLEVAKKYNNEQLNKFAKLMAITQLALHEKHQDFLGEVFMQNDMGNSYRGQYFTPFHISSFMAKINLGDSEDIRTSIKSKGFFTMCEPAAGSGGMIIACDQVIADAGLKSSEIMFVQSQDVDTLCFMMSFIQLSALDIPARVVLGNTLALEEIKVLYTPAFVRENWNEKLEDKEPVNNQLYNDELLEKFKSGTLF